MNPELRRTLQQSLKFLYYDWLVRKLYRCRYVKAFEIAGRIKVLGDTNKTIYETLAFRAKRKLSRHLPLVGASIFDRLTETEKVEMFDWEGDQAEVNPGCGTG